MEGESTNEETYINTGVPNLRAVDRSRSGPVRNQAAQQVSSNVMRLNPPEAIPYPRVWGKLVTMKPVPGDKKVGGCYIKGLLIIAAYKPCVGMH